MRWLVLQFRPLLRREVCFLQVFFMFWWDFLIDPLPDHNLVRLIAIIVLAVITFGVVPKLIDWNDGVTAKERRAAHEALQAQWRARRDQLKGTSR